MCEARNKEEALKKAWEVLTAHPPENGLSIRGNSGWAKDLPYIRIRQRSSGLLESGEETVTWDRPTLEDFEMMVEVSVYFPPQVYRIS